MKIRNGNGGHIYLSAIKLDVLKFIKKFIDQNEYSPTYLEIAKKFSFSRARAGAIIAELYKMNLITKINQAHRNIELTQNQLEKIPSLKVNKSYSTMEFRKWIKLWNKVFTKQV